jgi:F0F1-type ATP synthase membrane subunit b/b'
MDLDVTLALQAFIVLTVLVTLGPLLFNPMLELLELREKNIAGAKQESIQLVAETKAKETELQNQLEGARRSALGERQRMLNEAKEAERGLLDKARTEAMAKIETARAALKTSEANVRGQLQASGKDLAKQIATKILSRDVA